MIASVAAPPTQDLAVDRLLVVGRRDMARRIGALLEQLGTAAVIITHDLELVERMCPSVHFLADGQFVASGAIGEVLARGEHPAVREIAEAAPLAVQRFR